MVEQKVRERVSGLELGLFLFYVFAVGGGGGGPGGD